MVSLASREVMNSKMTERSTMSKVKLYIARHVNHLTPLVAHKVALIALDPVR